MTNHPRRVSVIVPTCDRPALLRQALSSIRALEGPDIRFEILVGDNGSMPESREAAAEAGAIYMQVEKRGAAAARNAAMSAATGEFLAFLDDDDTWRPGHIRPHIALLDAHPEFEAVFGQVVITDTAGRVISDPAPASGPADDDFFLPIMNGYFPQLGATVTRASAPQNFGLMDEALFGGQDWEWQLRIARRHKIGFAPVPCVHCRGRVPATYDALQRARVPYSRRIFFRHALPEWRRWRSPLGFMRSFFATRAGYYDYFADVAIRRAKAGERLAALKAVYIAFTISPIRAVYHFTRPRPISRAFVAAITPRTGQIAQ